MLAIEELSEYERRVLAATPGKALTFLRGVATKVQIRALLFAAGYSQPEHDLAWDLIHRATGYLPAVASADDDAAARAAMAELDEWDEPGFRRSRAALERLHPEQFEFVFAGLDASQGPESLLGVATFLDRLEQLENAPERAATREADATALATLAQRGIDTNVRQHLRGLLQLAQTVAEPQHPADPAVEARDQALLELRAWYKDWSETARAVITRKDYLITLGLSKRRRNVRDQTDVIEDVPETEVAVPGDEASAAVPAFTGGTTNPAVAPGPFIDSEA